MITIEDFAKEGYCIRNFDGKETRSSVRVPRVLWNYFCESCKKRGLSAYSCLSTAIKERPDGITQSQAALYTLFMIASRDGVLE